MMYRMVREACNCAGAHDCRCRMRVVACRRCVSTVHNVHVPAAHPSQIDYIPDNDEIVVCITMGDTDPVIVTCISQLQL